MAGQEAEISDGGSRRVGIAPSVAVVTGAAGFIGSHLVDALLARGIRVVGIDDFDPWYDPRRKRANLRAARGNPLFTLVEADLCSDDVTDRLEGADVVFHLAGRPGVQDSWGTDFGACLERNAAATQRVYEAALAAGVGRVVYASSSSIYGASAGQRTGRAAAPLSPYGVAKLAGEHLGGVYRARGLAVSCLRYFTVYGPRQRPDMAMHRLFAAASPGTSTFVRRGDGTQRREFTHVSDVVAATLAAGFTEGAENITVDIGGGSSVSLNEVVAAVEQITGSVLRSRSVPAPAGDPDATVADHGAARRLLGWEPTVGLDRGLRSQWAWHAQIGAEVRREASDMSASPPIAEPAHTAFSRG